MPRYRQRIAKVPGGLANPVWVDDPDFDLTYHVRRSALPRPGSSDQLLELVARIVSRPLDRHRPLWEVYFIEGLEEGRVAVLSKSHQVLVDGVAHRRPGQVLLDRTPAPRPMHHDDWRPLSAPSPVGLVADAVQDAVAEPATAIETARATIESALRSADGVLGPRGLDRRRARQPASGERPSARRARSPSSVEWSPCAPRSATTSTSATSTAAASTTSILATVTGALRGWLLARAESMSGRAPRAHRRAGVGERPRARDHLARQPDRRLLRRPAGRRDQPCRAAAPGVLRVQGAPGDRPRRRGQPAGRASPASRRRRSTRSGRGSRPTRLRRGLPAQRHQRPRAAVTAVRRWRADARDLPRAPPAAGTCAGDRRDVVRRAACSTASQPTAT